MQPDTPNEQHTDVLRAQAGQPEVVVEPVQPIANDAHPNAEELVVLHISDLHFGRDFLGQAWENFLSWAVRLNPSAIIVTGDLVDTPWRSRLKEAKRGLDRLADETKKPVWVVPGNHDTRLTGFFSVYLLDAACLIAIAIVATCFYFTRSNICFAFAGVIVALWIVRLVLFARFKNVMGKYAPSGPVITDDKRLGVLPFNTSPAMQWGAGGKVDLRELARFADALLRPADIGATSDTYWIAALHHHPIPIAYNAKHESLMLLDNAGALINEMGVSKVNIVLHGHRHQRRNSRVIVDASLDDAREVAIVSAGTLTKGTTSGSEAQAFNIIRIQPAGDALLQAYVAPPGGRFKPEAKGPQRLTSFEQYYASRFDRWKVNAHVFCEHMVCVCSIGEDGQATIAREYHDLKVDRAMTKFPYVLSVGSPGSHVGQVKVEAFDNLSGVPVSRTVTRKNLSEALIEIAFAHPVSPTSGPIRLVVAAQVENSFAMSAWQHREMYFDPADTLHANLMECMQFMVQAGVAVRKLTLILRLPSGHGLPQALQTSMRTDASASERAIESAVMTSLGVIDSHEVVVQCPSPGASYEWSWQLVRSTARGDGHVQKLRQLMLTVDQDAKRKRGLELLGEAIRVRAVELFVSGIGDVPQADVDVAFFAYDDATHKLYCKAATFKDTDPRMGAVFPFGLGLVGRAQKSGKLQVFLNPYQKDPEVYAEDLNIDGKRIEKAADVLESAVIAFTIGTGGTPETSLAVVQVSCRTQGAEAVPNMEQTFTFDATLDLLQTGMERILVGSVG